MAVRYENVTIYYVGVDHLIKRGWYWECDVRTRADRWDSGCYPGSGGPHKTHAMAYGGAKRHIQKSHRYEPEVCIACEWRAPHRVFEVPQHDDSEVYDKLAKMGRYVNE